MSNITFLINLRLNDKHNGSHNYNSLFDYFSVYCSKNKIQYTITFVFDLLSSINDVDRISKDNVKNISHSYLRTDNVLLHLYG